MRTVRVFISSPGDVLAERKRVERVIDRLNGQLAGSARLEAIRWETHFYTADQSFQPQIPESADCDIVVAILRHRLGTELPPDFPHLPTGEPYPSGTAYEILSALEASKTRASGLPDVYVFRHQTPPLVRLDDEAARAETEAQWAKVKAFFQRWFQTEDGHFTAAFHIFDDTDHLETQVEALLRAWIAKHLTEGRLLSWPVDLKGSPFRGLEAFGAKHAPVFFGRDRDTTRAVEALRDAAERSCPFLLVVGSSGCGKSSLVGAGLVPRLTTPGVVPGVDLWRVARLRPGEHPDGPLAELALQLFKGQKDLPAEEDGRPEALPELAEGDFSTPKALAGLLAHGDDSALRPVLQALDRVAETDRRENSYDRPVETRLLLVVDQMEELFSPAIPKDTRETVAALLRALVATGRVWVVGTLRADFYESLQGLPDLLALKAAGALIDLRPPGPAELAEILREPAKAAGLTYETDAGGQGLDERILADSGGDRGRADMLPLVQFVLNRLFETRCQTEDGPALLTLAAYEAMGGLDGAIDREAEQAFARLSETAQATLPTLLRLVVIPATGEPGLGEDRGLTARPVPWAEATATAASEALVAALVTARILQSSGDGETRTVRLTHERVLTSWTRARELAEANAEFFRVRQEVEEARQRWETTGCPSDRLIPPGVPLAEAEALVKTYGQELELGENADLLAYVRASGNRARRRQRLTALAAVVFLGVALGAGYFAKRAMEAEALAQQRAEEAETALTKATGAANRLVFDLAQRFKSKGLRTETVLAILDRARALQDELAESAPDNAALRRSRAVALSEQGNMLALRGEVEDATKAYEESLGIFRALAETNPGNTDWQRDVSVSLNKIGDLRLRAGDVPGATKAYDESLGIMRALAETDPGNTGWQRDISVSLERIGDLRLRAGDVPGATKAYDESLGIRRALAKTDPGNTEWQRDVSVSLNKIGDLRLRAGDVPGATKAYDESLGIFRALAETDPGNTGWQRDVSVSLNKIGDLRRRAGDVTGATKAYDESLDIMRALAETDPGNTDWQRDVSVSLERIGDLRLRAGDVPGATKAYNESLGIMRALAETDPGNTDWQRELSVRLDRIGDLRLRARDLPGATKAYDESLGIRRALAETDPGNVDWRRGLIVSLVKLAEAAVAGGEGGQARAPYTEALGIVRDMAAKGVLAPGDTWMIEELENRLAALDAPEGETR
ncbi:AAA family ATPase [Rhodospirillum sp. A1_3_36]|uniref:nSTAND1 domain-containing NTPase n=1 Tax=Rhodospirillum sp. A1_3_36 TaxID=3391666 RepID=UPI0039A478D5